MKPKNKRIGKAGRGFAPRSVRPRLPRNRIEYATLPNGRVMLALDYYQMKFRIEMSTSQTKYEIGYIYTSTGEETWSWVEKAEYDRVRKLMGL